ncbi:MAG: hypothetical protein IKV57_06890 [Clostridia bacterium]|nr:hypothetical protein [Clostridia bacterium]
MKGTKLLSLLMALLLCAPALASCGSTEEADTTASTTAADTEAVETEAPDPFAGTDFGGKELRVSSSNNTNDSTNAHHLIAGSGELNGEIVNDAVYKRNTDVEELLNVKLNFIPSDWYWGDGHTEIEKLVLSGDCGFEVVINDLINLGRIAHLGYFHSVSDNEIMDFSQPYWYGEAIADLEVVDGAAYMMLGDVFADSLASAHVLYYNKDIILNNYSDENHVQDIILAGDWTVDEMIRITEETAVDLDGDGMMTEGADQYGYAVIGAWGPMIPVLMGFDVQFVEETGGKISYCFNTERSVKILEKLNELYWRDAVLPDIKVGDRSDEGLLTMFTAQQTVFMGYLRLCDLERMRDIEFLVGLACYPKLDTTQENYVSSLHDTSEVGAIVVTAPATEMDFISTCLEVLGREAGRTIIPAYYEEALKIKYVNGSEDAAMIDLIHDSITSPFALAYNNILGDMLLAKCFLTPLGSKQADFASAYAKNESAGQQKLDELVAAFTDIVESRK